MTKRRQNAKVSPLSKKGKGKRKRQRFGQDGADMSPALFEMAERSPKAKYREMGEVSPLSKKGKGKRKRQRFGQDRGDISPALFEMAERSPKAKYREIGEVSPLSKKGKGKGKGKGKRTRQCFGQDGGETPHALFEKMVEEHRETRKAYLHHCKLQCSNNNSSVDRISMLPDELLGSILSRITFKEQIATSILSRRWRYLWTLTTRLDFDGVDSLLSINTSLLPTLNKKHERVLAREKRTLDFVSWINQVLASRKVSTIEDFKVYFDLGKKHQGFINEWLRYALACKVQRLELNLNATLEKHNRRVYVFPDRLFSHIDDEEVGCNPNPNPIHFKQLKMISLSHVGVDGKALEFFLHNCPLLEDLSVSNSSALLSLSVTGPFPSLKRLEISGCHKLESLEICDVINLVCFKYSGRENIHFLLRNLPMLVHLSVSGSIFEYMKVNVARFSSILEQLEIFNIHRESSVPSLLLPLEMSNLRQLEVVLWSNLAQSDESQLWLPDIIHSVSAPRLQKVVVESHSKNARFSKWEIQRMKVEKSYPHLKEVEFVGFCGVPSALEFVFHFVDNAPALKKIMINTKKTHAIFQRRNWDMHYHNIICRGVHNRLEKQLALKKPWIKLTS